MSTYDQIQTDNMIIIPSSKTLAKRKNSQHIKPGDCATMYEKRLLTREFKEEMAQLICDKMKLKQDFIMNVKLNTLIGFAEDFIFKKKY